MQEEWRKQGLLAETPGWATAQRPLKHVLMLAEKSVTLGWLKGCRPASTNTWKGSERPDETRALKQVDAIAVKNLIGTPARNERTGWTREKSAEPESKSIQPLNAHLIEVSPAGIPSENPGWWREAMPEERLKRHVLMKETSAWLPEMLAWRRDVTIVTP
jgi:hypothetical protein